MVSRTAWFRWAVFVEEATSGRGILFYFADVSPVYFIDKAALFIELPKYVVEGELLVG